jgi:hypothetical protein
VSTRSASPSPIYQRQPPMPLSRGPCVSGPFLLPPPPVLQSLSRPCFRRRDSWSHLHLTTPPKHHPLAATSVTCRTLLLVRFDHSRASSSNATTPLGWLLLPWGSASPVRQWHHDKLLPRPTSPSVCTTHLGLSSLNPCHPAWCARPPLATMAMIPCHTPIL